MNDFKNAPYKGKLFLTVTLVRPVHGKRGICLGLLLKVGVMYYITPLYYEDIIIDGWGRASVVTAGEGRLWSRLGNGVFGHGWGKASLVTPGEWRLWSRLGKGVFGHAWG